MKQNLIRLSVWAAGFIMLIKPITGVSQAQLILNGGVITIAQNAQLIIDNPASNAIARTAGYIVSEGENNIVKWNIGTTIGTYTIPWGYASAYIPITFTKTAGVGSGNFLFSTYRTGWQNSGQLPTGVANMNGASGTDNSAFAADRFWQINAQNYSTKPTLAALTFTYLDAEHSASGNTISENSLRANRYNSSVSSWTETILASTLNTTNNTVTVTSVDATNLHPWWVVGMLGANLYWVAPSNSTTNLSANWSLSSGGVGNAGVPTLVDVMNFDGNSTTNSTIDADLTAANLVVGAGYTGIIAQGGSKITLTNTATLSGGTISGGTADMVVEGTFTVSGSTFTSTSATLELKKNLIVTSGSFAHNNGTVKFSGTTTQNLSGSIENTFKHISVTNATANPSVSIESNQNLAGVLTLSANSIVDADGSSNSSILKLLSTNDSPTQDAAVGILPSGAQVTGNVTVQRFMAKEGPNNNRIYRYIASPVQNAAVSDFQNEIPVTGPFTGSSTCSGCLTNQSMFSYNETVITDTNGSGTADLNDGYINFPSAANSETFVPGRGYAVFVRADILSSSLWDVRGPINAGNVSNISLPVTYTSSGNILNDGWNLVGNPLPSTLDWNAATGWTKTNIDASIYIRDNGNSTQQFATWNGTTGTNGGSRNIAMGQGFWIKAHGSSPALSTNENTKASGTQTTFFREGSLDNLLRITMTKGTTRDETVVHFREDATSAFDREVDAWKLNNALFNLSSLSSNNEKLAINSWSELLCDTFIKLSVTDATVGVYSLHFTNLDSFTESTQLVLHDQFTKSSTALSENKEYSFNITADPGSQGIDRFVLLINKKPAPVVIHTAEGILSVPYKENIQWYVNDVPIPGATQSTLKPELSGMYSIVVNYKGCRLSGSTQFLVTDIEEIVAGAPLVYPNPVTNEVLIRAGKNKIQTIILLNSLGASMEQVLSSHTATEPSIKLNMESNAAGTYYLKIITEKETVIKKIVKL